MSQIDFIARIAAMKTPHDPAVLADARAIGAYDKSLSDAELASEIADDLTIDEAYSATQDLWELIYEARKILDASFL